MTAFIRTIANHEFGHVLGFGDLSGSNCGGNTALYNIIDLSSGPFISTATECDTSALGSYYPPPEPTVCYLEVSVMYDGYQTRGDGTGYYTCGTWVMLTATAPGTYLFAGWSGNVSSSSETIYVPVDSPYVYEAANFVPRTRDGCGDDCSPITLSFGNMNYGFSSAAGGVAFDIDGDGGLDRVGWPLDPASTAFLFRDRNGNGVPDSGRELFGNATPLSSGQPANNGFVALAELDENGDGIITAADPAWPDLLLWFDSNRNGRPEPGELKTLDAAGVTALQTSATWTGRRDANGNTLRWKSMFAVRGMAHDEWRPYYDVYLVTQPTPGVLGTVKK